MEGSRSLSLRNRHGGLSKPLVRVAVKAGGMRIGPTLPVARIIPSEEHLIQTDASRLGAHIYHSLEFLRHILGTPSLYGRECGVRNRLVSGTELHGNRPLSVFNRTRQRIGPLCSSRPVQLTGFNPPRAYIYQSLFQSRQAHCSVSVSLNI